MTGAVHRFEVRVYYEDTDAAGIVYYANYLRFAERARTEMLRALGLDHRTLQRDCELRFAVRRCVIDYLRPARLDDLLAIETRVIGVSGSRLELAQDILRQDEALARLTVTLVALDAQLRPVRISRALPSGLLELLQAVPSAGAPSFAQAEGEEPSWTN
jgi:acyl-CoA thioester hydrolase